MEWARIFGNALSGLFGVEVVVYGLAAVGLNVQFGYAGLLNFGQAAFLAVGGYSVAVTVLQLGLSLWLGLVVGLLAAAALALLLGIPTLRLRADYLAIVTIAAAEIVRLIVRSATFRDFFGGPTASPASPGTSSLSTPTPPTSTSDRSATAATTPGSSPSGGRSSSCPAWWCGPSCAARGAGS